MGCLLQQREAQRLARFDLLQRDLSCQDADSTYVARAFGNADGTGALFLMADGSVRFFSNKTSRKILEKLSTRDGADFVPEAEF